MQMNVRKIECTETIGWRSHWFCAVARYVPDSNEWSIHKVGDWVETEDILCKDDPFPIMLEMHGKWKEKVAEKFPHRGEK